MTVCVACANGSEDVWSFEREAYDPGGDLAVQERELRAKVQAYRRLLDEAKARADAIADEIKRLADAGPMAGLCSGHREHLHRYELRTRWASGRLGLALSDRKAKPLIREVLAYINDPAHQPKGKGACEVCTPGSTYQEEAISA
jgi:hypothetical protein